MRLHHGPNRRHRSPNDAIAARAFRFALPVLLLIGALAVGPARPAEAAADIDVTVDGRAVVFTDAKPILSEGRVLVPLRAVLEATGAKVGWDGKRQLVTVDYAKDPAGTAVHVEMQIGSRYTERQLTTKSGAVTSKVAQLDVPASMVGERTYVPLRASGEFLGYTVGWSDSSMRATLTRKGVASTKVSFPEYPLRGSVRQMHDGELAAFFLTNDVRSRHGIARPLGLDTALSKVARLKSQDMNDNDYFDHQSPTYGSPFDMMEQFGIKYQAAGENIAAGYPSPEKVVEGWENSPGHLSNMLKTSFDYIGIGLYEGDGKYKAYWTQQFIGV